MEKNRLSKILAACGVASRRKCEEIIFDKKVKVNNLLVTLPQTIVDPEIDKITIDGEEVKTVNKKVYIMMHKPRGYTCTHEKVRGKKIIYDLLKEFDNAKVTYFVGFVPSFKLHHSACKLDSYWVGNTSSNYIKHGNFITDDRLTAPSSKPYMFEVLYGLRRHNRVYVHNQISNHQQFLQSPFLIIASIRSGAMGDTDSIFWESDIQKRDDDALVDFMGTAMRLSQTIPFKVYNNSWYSIICESPSANDVSFFTEKIAKPMIAGRLFIPITTQYYLRDLQSLGFQTFGNVIDESFDLIEDQHTRWQAALDEAMKLLARNPLEVLAQIKTATDHNRQLLIEMQRDHHKHSLDNYLNKLILDIIPSS